MPLVNSQISGGGSFRLSFVSVDTALWDILGKVHCEYFCFSGGSHTSAPGPVHNPRRMGYSAGGSSSGSGAVVAAGSTGAAGACARAMDRRPVTPSISISPMPSVPTGGSVPIPSRSFARTARAFDDGSIVSLSRSSPAGSRLAELAKAGQTLGVEHRRDSPCNFAQGGQHHAESLSGDSLSRPDLRRHHAIRRDVRLRT